MHSSARKDRTPSPPNYEVNPDATRKYVPRFLGQGTSEWAKDIYRRIRDRFLRGRYDSRRFWTEFGKVYMDRFPPEGKRSEEIFVRVLGELGARSVVDVGCGYGRYLRALRQGLHLERLCGVDISPTMIAKAREFLKDDPAIELFVAPATALPLSDQSCDAVMTYSLMIHLRPKEVESFLREAQRVGRYWGVFLESRNNPEKPWLNPPYYFAHNYETLFAQAGMKIESRTRVHPSIEEYLYVVRLHSHS